MEKNLICPNAAVCYIYKIYVDNTKDDNLGIIKISKIENRDRYGCKALSAVGKLLEENKLPEKFAPRLQEIFACLLIEQANKSVEKRRQDL